MASFDDPVRLLLEVSARGDEAAVRALLAGSSVSTRSCNLAGETALHFAAMGGHGGVARLVIAHDSSLPGKLLVWDEGLPSPLEVACWNGDAPLLRMLLSALDRAAFTSKGSARVLEECVYAAVYQGFADVLRTLRAVGVDLSRCSREFQVGSLDYAMPDMPRAALKCIASGTLGLDSFRQKRGMHLAKPSPLYLAVMLGHVSVVDTLLELGGAQGGARHHARTWPSLLQVCLTAYGGPVDDLIASVTTEDDTVFDVDDEQVPEDITGYMSFALLLFTGLSPWLCRFQRYTGRGGIDAPVSEQLRWKRWREFTPEYPSWHDLRDDEPGMRPADRPTRPCYARPWAIRLRIATALITTGVEVPSFDATTVGYQIVMQPSAIALLRLERKPVMHRIDEWNTSASIDEAWAFQLSMLPTCVASGLDVNGIHRGRDGHTKKIGEISLLMATCCPEDQYASGASGLRLMPPGWDFMCTDISSFYACNRTAAERKKAYQHRQWQYGAAWSAHRRRLGVLLVRLGADPWQRLVVHQPTSPHAFLSASERVTFDVTVLSFLCDVGQAAWANELRAEHAWWRRRHACAARAAVRHGEICRRACSLRTTPGEP